MVALPSLDAIRLAAARLEGVLRHTPLVPLHTWDEGTSDVLLKLETLQPVRSFKIRGVFFAVASLSPEARQAGVSTVSAGNTAQALAWAARHFGVAARSLMPDSAPVSKRQAVEAYGGTPVLVPVDELFRYLREKGWESEPWSFVHPWIDRAVMTGHGSLGLEILEDAPDVESVFVPVGGGGLLAGVGAAVKALKPRVKIYAVEPEGCPSLAAALAAGRPVTVPCKTLCDGVAVPYITEEMFPLLRSLVDEMVTVSEDAVKAAMRRLALENKLVAEGAGALSVAAALQVPAAARGRSVCIVSGGNVDPDKLVSILQ